MTDSARSAPRKAEPDPSVAEAPPPPPRRSPDLALVLSGGGARAAYQVGILNAIAKRFPRLDPPILTGVSAGAINAAWLAAHTEPWDEKCAALAEMWAGLTTEQVLRVGSLGMFGNLVSTGLRLISGGLIRTPRSSALVDTGPLRELLLRTMARADGRLNGVTENIAAGRLCALAITASSYTSGQSVTWVEGPCGQQWERERRRSETVELTVEHVMASTSLPALFPAIKVGKDWYGDGGIRLTAPLSPAIHLGARKLLAITTRSANAPTSEGATPSYPSPAKIAGTLLDAIFLDHFDADALAMQRFNRLLADLPAGHSEGLRQVELLVMRPSRDLERLASACEPRLPASLKFLTRGLGTRQARSSEFLSLIMFQEDYLKRLIELGESDVEARMGEIEEFLGA